MILEKGRDAFFGIGYVLLTAWLFLVARKLFQLGRLERQTP